MNGEQMLLLMSVLVVGLIIGGIIGASSKGLQSIVQGKQGGENKEEAGRG